MSRARKLTCSTSTPCDNSPSSGLRARREGTGGDRRSARPGAEGDRWFPDRRARLSAGRAHKKRSGRAAPGRSMGTQRSKPVRGIPTRRRDRAGWEQRTPGHKNQRWRALPERRSDELPPRAPHREPSALRLRFSRRRCASPTAGTARSR